MTFQVGDRVVVVTIPLSESATYARADQDGRTGTIVNFNGAGGIGVQLDKPYYAGHTCDGHSPDGYGWYFLPAALQLIRERPPRTIGEFFKKLEGEACLSK